LEKALVERETSSGDGVSSVAIR